MGGAQWDGMDGRNKKRKGDTEMKGKKYIVTATSLSVYTVEITALNKEHALEKAGLIDGGEWKEINVGDWQVEDAREVTE
jgi:hypothetical protein